MGKEGKTHAAKHFFVARSFGVLLLLWSLPWSKPALEDLVLCLPAGCLQDRFSVGFLFVFLGGM